MKFLVLCVIVVASFESSRAVVDRTCESGTLNLNCGVGKTISIKSANYGRTSRSICPHALIRTTNCVSPSSYDKVFQECDGKESCSLIASARVFGDPCFGTYKYLEVDYTCQPQQLGSLETERACDGNYISIQCPSERPAVHIYDAFYGRKVPGSVLCDHPRTANTDCAVSGKDIVKSECQGKVACDVFAASSVFGEPCFGTYKYLEVNYTCAKRGRACDGSHLKLVCPTGQSLVIHDGFFGRTEGPNVCPSIHTSARDCRGTDKMDWVKDECNGKNTCTLYASSKIFGDPCFGTYKYLEVMYKCV